MTPASAIMPASKRRKKNSPDLSFSWDDNGTTTAQEDRASDAARMGEIAEGIKFMYESGQLVDATFTERQQNISKYVAATLDKRPGLRLETIVGFIMCGAGLSLTVPNGQRFMDDMIYYVAANFYARAPRWENDSIVDYDTLADEFIVHLKNRFRTRGSLQRYELNTVDYDALWARVTFGDRRGAAQKYEIEKLLGSGIGFTENLVPVKRVICEIEIGPRLLQGIPYFQAPHAKWSCGGPPLFSFDDGMATEIPIFNRQMGKNLPLIQQVLSKTSVIARPERVRAWLKECGSAKEISDDGVPAFKNELFASTSEKLQTFLGISPVAAKIAHAQLSEGAEGRVLPLAISCANRDAKNNSANGRRTLRWQAELMVLHELYTKSPEYPKLYLALDSDRKTQATTEVLRGVGPVRDTGPRYPEYQSIIDHYNITIVDIDAQLGMFPPIVREILSAERDVTRLFHLRVRRDWRSAIQKMLAIDGGGRYDGLSHYWLSDKLFQLITDWYMHGSLESAGGGGTTMRINIDYDTHKGIQKALASIFNHKVSLEVVMENAGQPAPLSILPVSARHQTQTMAPMRGYTDGYGPEVVAFLNAVFQPLHDLRKRPERLDVFDITFTALLAKLDTIDGALSGGSLQELPADTPDWVKHEYGSDFHRPVYNIFNIFRFRKLMNKLLILCRHNKDSVKMVINKMKAYHANGRSVRMVAYTKFAEMLEEMPIVEELLMPSEDDDEQYEVSESMNIELLEAIARRLEANSRRLHATDSARGAIRSLLDKLKARIKEWLETYGTQETPLDEYANPDEQEQRLVAFLLILSSRGGRRSVDDDEAIMGTINAEQCLTECFKDFDWHLRLNLLPIRDPFQIAKHICARPRDGLGTCHNRVDFTVPETNGSVTGHFVQSGDEPTIWGFRLFTKGMRVEGKSSAGDDRNLWERGKYFESLFKWMQESYFEYALAVTGDYTDRNIWDAIQDCSIWNNMSLNEDAHVQAMKGIIQTVNKRHEPYEGSLIELDEDELHKLVHGKVARRTINELIEPMFSAAVEIMLGKTVAEDGSAYMRASFTDLAIAE